MIGSRLTRVNRLSVPSGKSGLSVFFGTSTTSLKYIDEEPAKPTRELEWRKLPEPDTSLIGMFNRPVPKGTRLTMPRDRLRFAPLEFKKWLSKKKINVVKEDQRFVPARHQTLGCDLAAAHFLVHRNGNVKFEGQTEWIYKDEHGMYSLPRSYNPNWQLTHVDASGINLYYEGLENFRNLWKVTWANFSRNRYLDDWCLDLIAANFPNLEYLNISECPRVTERGLEALYKLWNLKKLIVTNYNKSVAFELTYVMLEDCVPGLTVEARDPAEEKDETEEENMTFF